MGEVGGGNLGFLGGLFSPDGQSVLAHGYQGAFHVWTFDEVYLISVSILPVDCLLCLLYNVLHSATQRKLVVPCYQLNSFGCQRFSVAGPSTWNSLPDSLCDPELSIDTFNRQLKTYIFCEILMTKCMKCMRDLFEYALYKFTLYFAYLLVYTYVVVLTVNQ